ncbi:MAG: hypothetical protein HY800_04025 [Ignavibacteriales bacterium]|nr:hypothetical protein [Ignavibacteriales bacterium]
MNFIEYAQYSMSAFWDKLFSIQPPITGFAALGIWQGTPVIAFNRNLDDTIVTSLYIYPFTEILLPRMGGLDEPQEPRIVHTANGKLCIVASRPISGTAHTLLLDSSMAQSWSDPLPYIHFGDQYVITANDSGRVAIVWSNADSVGFLESYDNGVSFTNSTILFATQITQGDTVRLGKGLDAVYVGNALFVVWSAVGCVPQSARILSWNPVGGIQIVTDSSRINEKLASSMHPLDDHLVIDRPSIGRYQDASSVGCAFVIFKDGEIDNDGWNYGDIRVAEGGLTSWWYDRNITITPDIDERYPKVAPLNYSKTIPIHSIHGLLYGM